jgi:hypothetical protein
LQWTGRSYSMLLRIAWQWGQSVSQRLLTVVLMCVAAASCLTCSKRAKPEGGSDWDSVEATPAAANRWDATPGSALGGATLGPNTWDATPGAAAAAGGSRWDATPGAGLGSGATPAAAARRNRWDETPAAVSGAGWGLVVCSSMVLCTEF